MMSPPGWGKARRPSRQAFSDRPLGHSTEVAPSSAAERQCDSSLSKKRISLDRQPTVAAIDFRCTFFPPFLISIACSMSTRQVPSCKQNFLKHSLAHDGSRVQDATPTATPAATKQPSGAESSCSAMRAPECSTTRSPRRSRSEPSGCRANGAPPKFGQLACNAIPPSPQS